MGSSGTSSRARNQFSSSSPRWSAAHSRTRRRARSGRDPARTSRVAIAKVASLRGFQDRRAGGPGGVEHGDHLVFGVGHLGEGERGGSRRRGARPADVGFEGSGAEEGQQQAVADLDKGDLARHVEGGWPAEALDVEATGGGEVGHSERNEVHAGLHGWIVSESGGDVRSRTPPASSVLAGEVQGPRRFVGLRRRGPFMRKALDWLRCSLAHP
jgi:hypothetical protein